MKLLGWMHRKLRQNNSEQMKDFISGQGLLDDQHYNYPKPNFGNRSFKQHHDSFLRKSFTGLEAAKSSGEDDYGEESAAAMSDLFHGFLAIGTLGSEHGNMDPATPTFAYSVDYITEKETDVTEDELKLVNDELEKLLAADVKDESESSARNSYVSTGRSSYGSTITLGGKSTEGQESGNVCPLQEYLFGAAVELSASEPPKVVKKEPRASLGELFQRTKMTDESLGYGAKAEREERRSEKDSDKSVMNLMKKKLKKKMLHTSSKSSAMDARGDSNSAEAKLHKILHMFHRKVHPEYSAMEKESEKHHIGEVKKKSSLTDHMFSDEDIMIYPRRNLSKKSIRRISSQSNPIQCALGETDMNREFWIKTDADYLVLEL